MEKLGEFLASLPEEIYIFLISVLPVVELRGAIPIGAAIGLPIYVNYPVAILGNMLPVPFILLFIPKILDFLAGYKMFRPLVAWLRKKANRGSQRVLKAESPGEKNSDTWAIDTQNNAKESEYSFAEYEKNEASTIEQTSDNTEKTEENSAAEGLPVTPTDISEKEQTDGDGCSKNTRHSYVRRDMSAAIFTALMLFVAIPLPGTGAWTGSLVAALFNLPRRRSLVAIFIGVLISGAIMSLASYGVVGFLSFLI